MIVLLIRIHSRRRLRGARETTTIQPLSLPSTNEGSFNPHAGLSKNLWNSDILVVFSTAARQRSRALCGTIERGERTMTIPRILWGGPVPIEIGRPAEHCLLDWAAAYGSRRPLLMTEGDDGAPIDPLLHHLEAAGLAVQPFDRASRVDTATVADAVAQYHFEGCDGLIAAGGWIPAMAAKATALMVGQRVPLPRLSETLGADRAPVDPSGIAPLAVVADSLDAAAVAGDLHIIDEAGSPVLLRHVALRPRLLVVDRDRVEAANARQREAPATLVLRVIDVLSSQAWPAELTPVLDAILDGHAPWNVIPKLASVLEGQAGPAWTLAAVAAARANLPVAGLFAAVMPTAAHAAKLDQALQEHVAIAASRIALREPLPSPLIDPTGLRALKAVAHDEAPVDVRPLLTALDLGLPTGPTRAGGRRGRHRDVA